MKLPTALSPLVVCSSLTISKLAPGTLSMKTFVLEEQQKNNKKKRSYWEEKQTSVSSTARWWDQACCVSVRSNAAAVQPWDAAFPRCFFYSPRKKPWWRQFASSCFRTEYIPHYPTLKHRALGCHKRKWLWQKMSNRHLSAGLKRVWCKWNHLVKSNERSRKFPERHTTQIIVISASLCEEGEQIKELREAEHLQMHIWPAWGNYNQIFPADCSFQITLCNSCHFQEKTKIQPRSCVAAHKPVMELLVPQGSSSVIRSHL